VVALLPRHCTVVRLHLRLIRARRAFAAAAAVRSRHRRRPSRRRRLFCWYLKGRKSEGRRRNLAYHEIICYGQRGIKVSKNIDFLPFMGCLDFGDLIIAIKTEFGIGMWMVESLIDDNIT
ncbi:hypothetical protein LINPERPRIM_LOCUS17484, partial [Linum perenne]